MGHYMVWWGFNTQSAKHNDNPRSWQEGMRGGWALTGRSKIVWIFDAWETESAENAVFPGMKISSTP